VTVVNDSEAAERTFTAILEFLRRESPPERVRHSIAVAALAAELCVRHDLPPDKGRLAGIGHDISRELDEATALACLRRYHLRADSWERAHPVVLHGKIGAVVLKQRFGVRDRAILDAVRDHVVGRPGMGVLSKILYAADFLEPGRGFLPEAERLALLALPLDEAVLRVTDAIVAFLHADEKSIAPVTTKMYDRLVVGVERSRASRTTRRAAKE